MDTLRDLDVVRAAPMATELRALPSIEDINEGAGDSNVMVVRFSPYNTWYEIDSFFEGQFIERTVRGAFSKTMQEAGRSCKVMFNHGSDMQIDQKLLGVPTDLREDSDSAVGEVELFTDASYVRDLIPGIRAGAYGSSFMFRVLQDEWDDEPERSAHNPNRLPERTIKEVRLMEFGPVTWPANPAATTGMRSMTDEFYERLRSRDPQRYDDLRARAVELRTPKQEAASQLEAFAATTQRIGLLTLAETLASTSADGAAPENDVEPAHSHSGLTPAQRAARLRELAYPFLREAS